MESTEQTNPAEQTEMAEQRDLPLNELSIPALAYLGDSVLELTVRRELVLRRGLSTAGDLNRASLARLPVGGEREGAGDARGRGGMRRTRWGNFLKEVSPNPFKNFQRIDRESANMVPLAFVWM